MVKYHVKLVAVAGVVGAVVAAAIITTFQFVSPTESITVRLQLSTIRDRLRLMSDKVDSIQEHIRALDGEGLTGRLSTLRSTADALETQLLSLKQMMEPRDASEILATARIRNEVLAREKLETRVDKSVFENRERIDAIQLWLLAGFIATIAVLLATAVVLLKKVGLLHAAVDLLQVQSNSQAEQNHLLRRTPANGHC